MWFQRLSNSSDKFLFVENNPSVNWCNLCFTFRLYVCQLIFWYHQLPTKLICKSYTRGFYIRKRTSSRCSPSEKKQQHQSHFIHLIDAAIKAVLSLFRENNLNLHISFICVGCVVKVMMTGQILQSVLIGRGKNHICHHWELPTSDTFNRQNGAPSLQCQSWMSYPYFLPCCLKVTTVYTGTGCWHWV